MKYGNGGERRLIFQQEQAIVCHVLLLIEYGQRKTVVVIIFILVMICHPLVFSECLQQAERNHNFQEHGFGSHCGTPDRNTEIHRRPAFPVLLSVSFPSNSATEVLFRRIRLGYFRKIVVEVSRGIITARGNIGIHIPAAWNLI